MSAGTFFKTFNSSDRTTTRTLLHEAIPVTGTLVKGTYDTSEQSDGEVREKNIKTFSHGMFMSIYDYPHLSSSANHIFDITAGFSKNDDSDYADTTVQQDKKANIYAQMAQVLAGYDTSGNVRDFDVDGDLSGDGGEKIHNAIFLNFSRLLVKDEIKKGSFSMIVGVGDNPATPFLGTNATKTISDAGAESSYKVNSPAGEYGILKEGSKQVGLIYYQAGIVVLNIGREGSTSANTVFDYRNGNGTHWTDTNNTGDELRDVVRGGSINLIADGLRSRIKSISFNNTTELNSTIYFCRASHNEFNYSSNPTYLDGSKIRVKNGQVLASPRAYVTTVGLYSADNELLATAKLSEPLRKDPTNELTLRVRLDY